MTRSAPDIDTTVTDGYAIPIGHNWDTVQEAYKVRIPAALVERLEAGKAAAIERHEGQGMLFEFGNEFFQIWAGASQGNKWVLENDDIQIHFGPPARDWPVTVRYLSAGLWEHGFQAVKDRVVHLLETMCEPIREGDDLAEWCHVSRADYCFDFYSPDFTAEMARRHVREMILAPSGVKIGVVGPSTHDETITLGFNRKGLQVQIYDKGEEVTAISGKTWMFKVWEREGYYPPESEKAKHVWRVEVRFGKEFLKDRNIRTFDALAGSIQELLAEALISRRMVTPTEDSHRERWPLHPLWAAVYDAAGRANTFLPVGRQITMRREEYKNMLKQQIAGTTRALVVADRGHYTETAAHVANIQTVKHAVEDERHDDKVMKCIERQRFMDEAT